MITLFELLADTAPNSPQTPMTLTDYLQTPLVPLILVLVIFFWISARSRSKERRRYEQMLGSLKRNDRVQTAGGLIGTVVDVRDNEVVLKVDEANNVKIRFNRTAIKEVLRDAPPAEKN